MRHLFFDTSCLVKELLQEQGSERLRAFTSQEPNSIVKASILVELEFLSIVRRKRAEGNATAHQEQTLISSWELLKSTALLYPISDEILHGAGRLMKTTPLEIALRSLDAIHLSTFQSVAQHLPGLILLTADRRMRAAAKSLGLSYFDPME